MIERLLPLLVSFMSRDFGVKVRRARRNGLLYLVVGLLLLTAYGAAVTGTVLFLADAYGTVAAMFAVAIATLALAIAVLAGILIVNRNDRKLATASPVGGALLAVAAASILPMVLRSRFMTGAATLGTIAFLASRISPDGGDDPSSPT
jgi:NADH:ubiquinone oxidoreductase subunit K